MKTAGRKVLHFTRESPTMKPAMLTLNSIAKNVGYERMSKRKASEGEFENEYLSAYSR